jgi:hypothetical protein
MTIRRESKSFAPAGAGSVPAFTHGLRRGLHSYAALRLNLQSFVPRGRRSSSFRAPLKARVFAKNARGWAARRMTLRKAVVSCRFSVLSLFSEERAGPPRLAADPVSKTA